MTGERGEIAFKYIRCNYRIAMGFKTHRYGKAATYLKIALNKYTNWLKKTTDAVQSQDSDGFQTLSVRNIFTLFTACGREGGRAKQRPGESTM
jgi:hypothetical protein